MQRNCREEDKWARPHLQKATAAVQQNAKFVGNVIPALESLRFFGSAAWIGKRFNDTADEIYENWREFCIKRMYYCAFYGVAICVQFSITYSLLLPQYKACTLSIGDIVLFNLLLLQLNQPFEMVGQTIDNFIRAFVQISPFANMWGAPEEKEAGPSVQARRRACGARLPGLRQPRADGAIQPRRAGGRTSTSDFSVHEPLRTGAKLEKCHECNTR